MNYNCKYKILWRLLHANKKIITASELVVQKSLAVILNIAPLQTGEVREDAKHLPKDTGSLSSARSEILRLRPADFAQNDRYSPSL